MPEDGGSLVDGSPSFVVAGVARLDFSARELNHEEPLTVGPGSLVARPAGCPAWWWLDEVSAGKQADTPLGPVAAWEPMYVALPSAMSTEGPSDPEAESECSTADTAERPPRSPEPVHAAPRAERHEPLPSAGSAGHHVRRCKPCAFFDTKGCESGTACLFCHLCEPGEKKRRQKLKKAHFSAVRQSRQQAGRKMATPEP